MRATMRATMRVRRSLAVVIGLVLIAGVVVVVDGGADISSPTAIGSRPQAPGDVAPSAWRVRARQNDGADVAAAEEPSPAPNATPAVPAALHAFGSCDGVLAALKREGIERVTPWGLPSTGDAGMPGAAQSPTAAGGTAAGGTSAGPAGAQGGGDGGYSTTNVQEQGVAEPDVVQNTGERIVTLFDGRLRTLVREGTTPVVTDTVALATPSDAEMLMVGDRVVVLAPRWSRGRPATRVVIVDVSDPTDAVVTSDVTVDGQYVSARSADDVVRLVVTSAGPSLTFTHPARDDEAALEEALERNREIVSTSSLEDWLPDMASTPVAGCDGVLAPMAFSGFGSTTVLTLDPAVGELVDATTVTASASEVYASPDHLYVAAGVWPLDGSHRPEDELTQVHRFDISDPRRARYDASGAVPGHLIRPFLGGGGHVAQWAMSEHDGDLRVATTIGESQQSVSSSVTVLRREGSALVTIGAVTGLGPTEQIYAVRFMGERGYVVTYRRVDPLYVLDLADPREPRLLGELKVPGYSAYLHPIAEGVLLGIGQDDPDEDGLVDGTQVSVFDVTDAARPRRTAQLRLGARGTFSAVEGDHRAFTWWADPARAILPLRDNGGFDGAVALDVSRASIAEVGRVEHRFGGDDACAAAITRARVIDGVVYTFSGAGVRANDVDDFELQGTVDYDDGPECHPEPRPEPPPSTTTTTTTTPGLLPTPPRG